MDRSIPVSSKVLAKKWTKENQKGHERRMENIRANVDNKEPDSMNLSHMKFNAKKQQMRNERAEEIARDNVTLVKKMASHMNGHGTVDHILKAGPPKSLNSVARSRELQRITEENRRLMSKLINQKPILSNADMENDFIRSRRNMRRLCELPVVLGGIEPEEHTQKFSTNKKQPKYSNSDYQYGSNNIIINDIEKDGTVADYDAIATHGERQLSQGRSQRLVQADEIPDDVISSAVNDNYAAANRQGKHQFADEEGAHSQMVNSKPNVNMDYQNQPKDDIANTHNDSYNDEDAAGNSNGDFFDNDDNKEDAADGNIDERSQNKEEFDDNEEFDDETEDQNIGSTERKQTFVTEEVEG